MKTKRFIVIVSLIAMAVALPAKSAEDCIKGAHHYEGSPKPNVYVVIVTSSCDEKRDVTLIIADAIYGAEVDRVQFALAPGDSREIRHEYTGEKYFSYSIAHSPSD